MAESDDRERSGKSTNLSKAQTILLAIIAGCLLVIVYFQVIAPAIEENRRQDIQRTFDEISSGLSG